MSKINTIDATRNLIDFIGDNFHNNPKLVSVEADDSRIEVKFIVDGDLLKIILLQATTNEG